MLFRRGLVVSLDINSSLQILNKDPEEKASYANTYISRCFNDMSPDDLKSDICFYFASSSTDILVLHVILLQDGVHHIEVLGGHMDVHVSVDGYHLSTVRVPEIYLQMAPKPNT